MRIGLLVACIALVGAAPLSAQQKNAPTEPWIVIHELNNALGVVDPKVRRHSAAALGKVAQELGSAANGLGLRLRVDPDPQVRAEAAAALANFGLSAHVALPDLVFALKDQSAKVRRRAAHTLGRLDALAKPAVPDLIRALEDPDVGDLANKEISVRAEAVKSLGDLGRLAKSAVPPLLKVYETGDPYLRSIALESIGRVGRDDKCLIPLFIKALKKDRGACMGAAFGIGYFGPAAKEAVPDLVEALEAKGIEDAKVAQRLRLNAMWSLGQIGPAAKAAIPALERFKADPDLSLRVISQKMLEKIRASK